MKEQAENKSPKRRQGKAVTFEMDPEVLKGLHEVADSRGISLNQFLRRLTTWASQKEGLELAKLGVDLPVYIREMTYYEKDSNH